MKIYALIFSSLLITSCASDKTSQNLYSSSDIGKSIKIKTCTVISARSIIIRDENSGEQGEKLGFIAGNIGSRSRNKPLSGFLGGLIGGAIGRQVSDKLHEKNGIEYTVILKNGEERQLVQDLRSDETILNTGDSCRLQISASSNRVLPANHFPSKVKRPTTVKFTNE